MFAKLRTKFMRSLSLALLLLMLARNLPVSEPSILGIYPSQEVTHPEDWKGQKVMVPIPGETKVRLRVEGFASDLKQEVIAILFKDDAGELVYSHNFSQIDAWHTCGTSYVTFIVPSLDLVRQTTSHSKQIYQFKYHLELKIKGNHMPDVECKEPRKCVLIYSWGFTPLVQMIQPGATVSNTRLTYIVKRLNDIEIGYSKESGLVPIKEIKIDGQICDYFSDGLITAQSELLKNRFIAYQCDIGDFKPLKHGTFNQIDAAGKAHNLYSSKTHLLDKSSFNLQVLPSITSVSHHQGNSEGGLDVTVKGLTWDEKNTQVFADGVECNIISGPVQDTATKEFELTCKTQKTQASSGSGFAGGHGWVRQVYLNAYLTTDLSQRTPDKRDIMFNGELPLNEYQETHISVAKTFFRPPMGGIQKYRFRMAQDDHCDLYLHNTKPNVIAGSKDEMSRVLRMDLPTSFRHFYEDYNEQTETFDNISEWFTLDGTKRYYMEMWMQSYGGQSHCTLGLEVFKDIAEHPQNVPNVMRVGYTYQARQDKYHFKLHRQGKPLTSQFQIVFKLGGAQMMVTPDIALNDTPEAFEAAVKAYFQRKFGRNDNLKVNKNYYLADGTTPAPGNGELEKANNSIFVQFVIQMTSLHTGQRETTSTIPALRSPDLDLQLCSTDFVEGDDPVGGTWRLKVFDPATNSLIETSDLPHNAEGWQVLGKIESVVDDYFNKMEIIKNGLKHADGSEKGFEYVISFDGYRKPIQLFQVDTSQLYISRPQINGNGNRVLVKKYEVYPRRKMLQEHSTKLLFIPAPYQFFYTPHSKPQITVTSNGRTGVCDTMNSPNVNCDFEYIDSGPKVNSFTTSADFTEIQLSGINLESPTISKRIWAGEECVYDANTRKCTITSPAAGKFVPEIFETDKGYVTVNAFKTEIPPIVSSLVPTSIYRKGGQILTVKGSRFPLDKSMVKVFLAQKQCDLIEIKSSTELTCLTPELGTADPKKVTVQANEVNSQDNINVNVDALSSASLVEPASALSTEKQNLQITLIGIFEQLSDISKYTVWLENASHKLRMKVNEHAWQNSKNVLKVRYPGGFIGEYTLIVKHEKYGTVADTSKFRIGAKITSISPKEGSLAGGTLVTVTGQDFDIKKTQVYFGRSLCTTIGTPTPTEIKCLSPMTHSIDANGAPADGEVQVAVVTDITDDVTCANAPDCLFKWKSVLTPKVTDSSVVGEDISITGQGFGSNAAKVKVTLDGIEQTTVTVSGTTIAATMTELSSTLKDLIVGVSVEGKGAALVVKNAAKLRPYIPNFKKLEPSSGSAGGSKLLITGNFFPRDFQGKLQFTDGTVLCDSLVYESRTQLTCVSNPGDRTQMTTQLYQNTEHTYNCGVCIYETDRVLTPVVTSITRGTYTGSSLAVNLLGSNFPTAGATVKVWMEDKEADLVTITSDSQLIANFDKGPGFVSDVKPLVQFSNGHRAEIQGTYTEPFSATIPTAVSCSFVGGCDITLTGAKISDDPDVKVNLAGYECIRETTPTSADQINCTLPALPTKQSLNKYSEFMEPMIWHTSQNVEIDSSLGASASNAFDEDPSTSSEAQDNCYLGFKVINNHVATIEGVRFLIHSSVDQNRYVDGQFRASKDGVTWTTLYKVESPPIASWNTMDNDCTTPEPIGYSMFRYVPSAAFHNACDFLELEVKGKIMVNNNSPSYTLPVDIVRKSTKLVSITNKVTYSTSFTPTVTKVGQKYLNLNQPTAFTVQGTGFGTQVADVEVRINGKVQTVNSVTDTLISATSSTCAPDNKQTTFEVYVKGKGQAAIQGHQILCAYYWSDENIWSGEFAPGLGDTAVIPKGMHLIVDVDAVPKLQAVIVQGSLIFLPHATNKQHVRTFDAEYIMVDGGHLQIGTESEPYDSQFVLTLHGTIDSPTIPIYGNKVIANRFGVVDIHGVDPNPSWLELYETANPGDRSITLNTQSAIDWKVGDTIVIAPTAFDFTQTDECKIVSKSNTAQGRPVLNLDCALKFEHYAGSKMYGTDSLEMRAEVGLLSRNVVIQGDAASAEAEYGAHMMIHSPGDESSVGRIENAEFRRVGQAFKLGRYPIHFHMIGFTRKSYIRRNAVHHTYNRAVTIHGVHCLHIEDNVAFHTKGHTYFIEDAAETRNKLIHNLAIRSDASNSLLNTDSTPSSFWITHPNNDFINNHAAGAKRYGFWYDLQQNSIGPSASPNICPVGEKLGIFDGNVAHSNGRYGLRIFHEHIPRKYPCKPVSRDRLASDPSGPFTEDLAFGDNPAIPAEYKNFLSYKNGRCGIIAEKIGAVQFKNIKAADNKDAGIEITLPGYAKTNEGFVDGALIVGFSQNTKGNDQNAQYHGITTGQRDTFIFRNIKFYDFDGNSANPYAVAIGTCSHCSFTQNLDGFANTYELSGLSFINTSKKLKYEKGKTIFLDKDGSLSGSGQQRWITKQHPHLEGNTCIVDASLDDSVVCFAKILKVLVHAPEPVEELQAQKLVVIKKGDLPAAGSDWTPDHWAKASQISQNRKKIFWEVQFVAGREYHLHWENGVDFTNISFKRTRYYTNQHSRFILHFNFTDQRETYEVTGSDTILGSGSPLSTQQTVPHGTHYLDKVRREVSFMISENPLDYGLSSDSDVTIQSARCQGVCTVAPNTGQIETRVRKWSNPNDWRPDPDDASQTGAVPGVNADVVIQPTWNMFYDIDSNPIDYNTVTVHGRLTFDDPIAQTTKTIELRTKQLIVDSGELNIGSESVSYKNKAVITLLGEQNDPTYMYGDNYMAGNKIFFVSGNFTAHGYHGASRMKTQLLAPAAQGATTIALPTGLGWKAGEQIAIAPTSYDYKEHEIVTIVSYDNGSGATTITPALQYTHYGALSQEQDGQLKYDLRAEVGLLSRNIKIQGDERRWGGQLYVAEWLNSTSDVLYSAKVVMKNVELVKMSQFDTFNAAVRAVNLKANSFKMERCSIHSSEGLGMYITNSKGVELVESVIYKTHRNAIVVRGSENLVLRDNLIMNNKPRPWDSSVKGKDFQVAVDICVGEEVVACKNFLVSGNVATGGAGIGFTAPVDKCDIEPQFTKNVAHSYEAGWIAHYNEEYGKGHCGSISDFVAHHNTDIALQSFFFLESLTVKRVVIVDNEVGLSLGLGNGDSPLGEIVLEDSLIMGEHIASQNCQVAQEAGNKKVGLYSSFGIAQNMTLPYIYPKLGFHHVGADASRGKRTVIRNVKFSNFNQRGCGVGNAFDIFQLHPEASDLIMEHVFQDITLHDIADDNLMYLMDPPIAWAVLSDCVGFPCTAPEHVLLSFTGSITEQGVTSLGLPSTPFQVIHKLPGAADSQCTARDAWNAYVCNGQSLALIQFESMDPDTLERSVQPVYIKDEGAFDVKLNSFMDHIWDGFYTGSLRLTRFVSLIRHNPSTFYNISFTGSPPLKQLFEIYSSKPDEFFKIRIDYPNPDVVRVLKNDQPKLPNPIINGASSNLAGDECGENRWDPVASMLEFTLQGKDCVLKLETTDSIQLSFRLQSTVQQFYSTGGTDKFVRNLASALGINTSRIRILGVYEGSVVVDSAIEPMENVSKQEQIDELNTVKEDLQTKINDNSLDVGAKMLDFSISMNLFPGGVITDPVTTGGTPGNPQITNGNGDSSSSSSLHMWHMGLIVVAIILLVTVIILLIHCHLKRKRRMQIAATKAKFRIKTESFKKVGGANTISNQSVIIDVQTPRRDVRELDTPSSERVFSQDLNFEKQSARVVIPKMSNASVRKPYH